MLGRRRVLDRDKELHILDNDCLLKLLFRYMSWFKILVPVNNVLYASMKFGPPADINFSLICFKALIKMAQFTFYSHNYSGLKVTFAY